MTVPDSPPAAAEPRVLHIENGDRDPLCGVTGRYTVQMLSEYLETLVDGKYEACPECVAEAVAILRKLEDTHAIQS